MNELKNINKIIGIGLPKTGTSTLSRCLTAMNIPTLHFGSNKCDGIRHNMYRGIYKYNIMNKYKGITNAFDTIYPQIDKTYPNSVFILTIRNKDDWLKSCEKHFNKALLNVGEEAMTFMRHNIITFGTCLYNEDRFSYVYDTHLENAQRYFQDRKDSLLTINICEADNLGSLYKFLAGDLGELKKESKKIRQLINSKPPIFNAYK